MGTLLRSGQELQSKRVRPRQLRQREPTRCYEHSRDLAEPSDSCNRVFPLRIAVPGHSCLTEATNRRWLCQCPRPLLTARLALRRSGQRHPPSGGTPFESQAPARKSLSRVGRTRARRRQRSASGPGHLLSPYRRCVLSGLRAAQRSDVSDGRLCCFDDSCCGTQNE
jgi:hypothetical protein